METPPVSETYDARGSRSVWTPGWQVRIVNGRILYAGDNQEQRIEVARPEPVVRPNGHRYVTAQLAVDVAYERCNDALSGAGYEHRVTVTVGQRDVRGCGGARRTDWDI